MADKQYVQCKIVVEKKYGNISISEVRMRNSCIRVVVQNDINKMASLLRELLSNKKN